MQANLKGFCTFSASSMCNIKQPDTEAAAAAAGQVCSMSYVKKSISIICSKIMLRYMKYTFYSWTFHVTCWTLFWTLFHCVRTKTIRLSEHFIPGSISEHWWAAYFIPNETPCTDPFVSSLLYWTLFSGTFFFLGFCQKIPMMRWPQDQIELKNSCEWFSD